MEMGLAVFNMRLSAGLVARFQTGIKITVADVARYVEPKSAQK